MMMLKQLILVIIALELFLPYSHASSYGTSTEKYAKFDTAANSEALHRNHSFLKKMAKDSNTHVPPIKHESEGVTAPTADTINIGNIDLMKRSEKSDVESLDGGSGSFGGNDSATIKNSTTTVKNNSLVIWPRVTEIKEAHHKNSTKLMSGIKVDDSSPNIHSTEDRTEGMNSSAEDTQKFGKIGVSKTFKMSKNESRNESGDSFGRTDGTHVKNSKATEKPDYSVTWPTLIKIEGRKTNSSHIVTVNDSSTRVNSVENRIKGVKTYAVDTRKIGEFDALNGSERSVAESRNEESGIFRRNRSAQMKNSVMTEKSNESASLPAFGKIEAHHWKNSQPRSGMKAEDSITGLPFTKNRSESVNAFTVSSKKNENVGVVKTFENSLAESLHGKSGSFRVNNGQRMKNSTTTEKSNDLVRGPTFVRIEAQYVNNSELMSGIQVEDHSTGGVFAENRTYAINSSDTDNKKRDLKIPKKSEDKSRHNISGSIKGNQDAHKKNTSTKNGLARWPTFVKVLSEPENMSLLISKEKIYVSSATVASDDNITAVIYDTNSSNNAIERISAGKTPKNPVSVSLDENGDNLIEIERSHNKNFTTKEKSDDLVIWPTIKIPGMQMKNFSLPVSNITVDDASFDFPSVENNADVANASNIYRVKIRRNGDLSTLEEPPKDSDSTIENKSADTTDMDSKAADEVVMEVVYSAIFALLLSFAVALIIKLKKECHGSPQPQV